MIGKGCQTSLGNAPIVLMSAIIVVDNLQTQEREREKNSLIMRTKMKMRTRYRRGKEEWPVG